MVLLSGLGVVGYESRDRLVAAGRREGVFPTANPTPEPTPTPTASPTEPDPTPTPSEAATKEYGGKALTVARPRVRQELQFSDGARTAPSDSVFLLLHLTAENVSTQLLNHPSAFSVAAAETDADVAYDSGSDGPGSLRDPELDLYGPVGVFGSGVVESGWAFATIPESVTSVVFEWTYKSSVRDESEKTITWQLQVPDST